VLELDTWPKPEKPYTRELEEKLIAVIKKADAARVPARFGVGSAKPRSTAIASRREPTSRPMRNCSSCVSRT
jgi:hypothetical protein